MIQLFRNWIDRHFSDPQVVVLIFLLLLGFILVMLLGHILTPVIASIVIAYLLDGMVLRMQQIKIPRIVSVLVVFIIFIACGLFLITFLLPKISKQIAQLLQELPAMIALGQKQLTGLPARYPGFISEGQIAQILNFIGNELTRFGQSFLSLSLASVRGFISVLVYLILVPFMVFFFLKDKELILDWFADFLPENRSLVMEVWHDANRQIGNYIRGKAWEILIIWTASYITFVFIDLNFTMLLAFFVGLSVIVPYIGVTVMFFPVAIIAYFQWGWGPDLAYAIIAYSVIQLLDGNLLAPLLLSEVVNLHPVVIITAVLIFGGIWGIWGLFFAIPLATLIEAVFKAWSSHRRKAENAGDIKPEEKAAA